MSRPPTRDGAACWGCPRDSVTWTWRPRATPADLIPQFNPNTSAVYSELGLAGLLQTINREHVSTVGLMATDARDKLFLAQELARYAPDVSIFTAESDSLYAHPDYSSFLRGALVASTYPLHSGNQRWSYGFQGATVRPPVRQRQRAGHLQRGTRAPGLRQQWPAARRRSTARCSNTATPASPASTGCQPPVWVSVVGSSTTWPVRAYKVPDSTGYVFAVTAPGRAGSPALFPSTSFHVLLYLLTAVLIAGVVLQARHGVQVFAVPEGQPETEAPPPGLGYLLAGLVSLLTVQGFLVVLCLLRVSINDRSPADDLPALRAWPPRWPDCSPRP